MNQKIFVFILTLLLFTTSVCCVEKSMAKSKSDAERLVNCLKLTKDVDSIEVNSSSVAVDIKAAIDIKINIKVENIHGNTKGIMMFDVAGKKMEFYFNLQNNEASVYLKDDSGEYSVMTMDTAKLGEINITRTFDAYIELIESNPELVNKINNNTYQLNIPQNQIPD